MAGLTAARLIAASGHDVTVLDKGRRPGGRMATKQFGGGASADSGCRCGREPDPMNVTR